MKKPKVIAIVGPTATGKSALAVELARKFHGEVISADSRQVYRGLNIGTGKITKEEMRGVPHHLLDVAAPQKTFTAAEFAKLAQEKILEISSRGSVPIICGGTGFYIDSALGLTTLPEVAPNKELRQRLEKLTTKKLFKKLEKLDKARAKSIDKFNRPRLIRAIEIAATLGKVPKVENKKSPYEVMFVGIDLDNEKLKERISLRLQERLKRGMINEARGLHRPKSGAGLTWKRMEELGLEYRYLSRFLKGEITKQEMIDQLLSEIFQYAKRQRTWFRRNKKIEWYEVSRKSDINKIAKRAKEFLTN